MRSDAKIIHEMRVLSLAFDLCSLNKEPKTNFSRQTSCCDQKCLFFCLIRTCIAQELSRANYATSMTLGQPIGYKQSPYRRSLTKDRLSESQLILKRIKQFETSVLDFTIALSIRPSNTGRQHTGLSTEIFPYRVCFQPLSSAIQTLHSSDLKYEQINGLIGHFCGKQFKMKMI